MISNRARIASETAGGRTTQKNVATSRSGSEPAARARGLRRSNTLRRAVGPRRPRIDESKMHARQMIGIVRSYGRSWYGEVSLGGSCVYDLPGLTCARNKVIESPWGEPSSSLLAGEIVGLPIVFLSRHDKGHRLSPSDINYRANIDVLKRAGVTDLVSLSACGSFREELPPGTFALIDQFVDRTHSRANSFFGTLVAWPMSRWRIRCRRGCVSSS